MTPRSCVVFDIDDTLYLERDYVRSGFTAIEKWAKENLGADGVGTRAWELFEAGHRGDVFNRALTARQLEPTSELIKALVDAYRAHAPDITMLPDAAIAVAACAPGPLAVLTDGPLASQRAKAAALGVDSWAGLVVFTAELGDGFGKPDVRSFASIESWAGVNGPACSYVADNPAKDFAGPAALGWRTVRVRRRGSLHEATASGSDVDVTVDDLTELRAVLQSLSG